MQKKKGISLIVLVITIIVMIILAAAIILSLNNAGIIGNANKAVEMTNLGNVQDLASLSWAEAYAANKRTQSELEEYVKNKLKENNVDLSNYAINVTTRGVDVVLIPASWKASVKTIVDGVPIPKGFVVSPYSGENTKAGGLVIYELENTENVIPETETQEISMKTRNQFVWVPVDDFSDFKVEWLEDGDSQLDEEPGGYGYFEMTIGEDNMPLKDQNTDFVSPATLSEVQAMYLSVKKYGGFYISRYEPGINSFRNTDDGVLVKGDSLYFVKDKYPYTNVPWSSSIDTSQDGGGAVEVARSVYQKENTKYGVVSTMIYSVQWDAACKWFLESKTKTELSRMGYYGDKYIKTGTSENAKINNIYDMGGNASEYTMELSCMEARALRGGESMFNLSSGGGNYWPGAVYGRNSYIDYQNFAAKNTSFRVALYIK